MADVILIQPKLGFQEDIVKSYSIPLGLLQSAVFLDKQYSIKIIDQRVDKNWKKTLISELNKNPICIGITSKTGNQLKYALDICKIIKNRSKIPIIIGGLHCSILPEKTLENKYIDYTIIGEGEYTFPELVTAIKNKKGLHKVNGIGYKKDKKIIVNPKRKFLDMEKLPEVPYHLVNLKKYYPKKFFIQTSRGCTFECSFCYNNFFNSKRKWRSQSSRKVIKTLKHVIDMGIKDILFIDDHFFADMKRVEKIMDWLIKNNVKIKWHAEGTRIDSLANCTPSFLNKMIKSGCASLRFGLESGSPKILNDIKKELNIKDVIRLNRRFKKTNIELEYNTMCGFPNETYNDLKKTVNLILKLTKENQNSTVQGPSILGAYPRTEIFEEVKKYGINDNKTLEEWAEYEWTNTKNIPWVSKRRKKTFLKLYMLFLFIDNKLQKDDAPYIMKLLGPIYRFIARFRCKHMFFSFMPEYWIHERILRIMNYKQ